MNLLVYTCGLRSADSTRTLCCLLFISCYMHGTAHSIRSLHCRPVCCTGVIEKVTCAVCLQQGPQGGEDGQAGIYSCRTRHC